MCQTVTRSDVAYIRRLLAPINPVADVMKDFGPHPDERVGWKTAEKLDAQLGLLEIWGGKRLVMQVVLSDEQ